MITIPGWLAIAMLCALWLWVGILIGRRTGNGAKAPPKQAPRTERDIPKSHRIGDLMNAPDPEYPEEDQAPGFTQYKRRDKPERRDDWAAFVKAQQDHDDEG